MAENTVAETGKKDVEIVREETREPDRYVNPPVDIYETEDGLTVVADIPGADKDRINISVENSILTIKAGVATSASEDYAHREFELVPYFRQFTLGEVIDRDKINAELKNGVLKLTLPLAEKAKPRQIEVKMN